MVRTAVLDELVQRMPALLDRTPSTSAAVEPTEGRSERADKSAVGHQMVGGARLAKWLKAEMHDRDRMTPNRLEELGGPARKTITKILNGGRVRRATLEKLCSGLSVEGSRVSPSDVPVD